MPKSRKRRTKHKPQRTCVGCRNVEEKRTLIRIVRTTDGVQIDQKGKLAGRGAYLHDRRSCWQKGLGGRLENALKITFSIAEREGLKAYAESLSADESTPL